MAIERSFRLLLKVVYDTYIGRRLSLRTQRLDFMGRTHAVPLPYLVWPLDPLQSRLCGGRNQCYAASEVRWREFESDYEETVLKTFGNRFSYEPFHTTCGGAFHDDIDYGPNAMSTTDLTTGATKTSSITEKDMRVKQNLAEWKTEIQ